MKKIKRKINRIKQKQMKLEGNEKIKFAKKEIYIFPTFVSSIIRN